MAFTCVVVGVLLGLAMMSWPTRQRRAPLARRRPRGGWDGTSGGGTSGGSPPLTLVPVPVVLDLLAAALSAGLSTSGASSATLDALGTSADDGTRIGLQPARLRAAATSGVADHRYAPLARALALSDRTGASAAVLLRAAATDEREARRRRAAVATGRLGVRLVLPLGLTTLPAFVLLGVVPVVLGLAGPVLAGARGG